MAQTDPGVRQTELLRYYENLRRIALGDLDVRSRNPYGLALLLYQGLAAWMSTWMSCLASLDTDAASATPCPRQRGKEENMLDMTAEVVSIIATMILALSREEDESDTGSNS